MSDIRTKQILAQLIEDLSLAIIKAKAQLEYVEEEPFDETDDSDDLFWNGGVSIWE
tara:strand:+ start:905 stop:1072 length:168 start_codon:yes stop_codon:yes gene_type:complete